MGTPCEPSAFLFEAFLLTLYANKDSYGKYSVKAVLCA